MTIKCEKCGCFVSDDNSCLYEFYKINDDFYCPDCVCDMKYDLNKNLNDYCCDFCDNKLIAGNSMMNSSDSYYKINDDFYCVDCMNRFEKDSFDFYDYY